jgi:hypothetical protein
MVVTGVATTLSSKCTKKKKGKVSFPYNKTTSPMVGTESFFHAIRVYFCPSVGDEAQF